MPPKSQGKKKSTLLPSREIDSVKFLVDECTGIWVSKKLAQLGFDSVSVIECMKGASDEEIIRKAIEENRVIVTNDKYFGRLAGFNKLPWHDSVEVKQREHRKQSDNCFFHPRLSQRCHSRKRHYCV
jgi:predicted nuclease of predicted toxin-antitoxin system